MTVKEKQRALGRWVSGFGHDGACQGLPNNVSVVFKYEYNQSESEWLYSWSIDVSKRACRNLWDSDDREMRLKETLIIELIESIQDGDFNEYFRLRFKTLSQAINSAYEGINQWLINKCWNTFNPLSQHV